MLDITKREVGTVSVLSLNGSIDLDGAQNLKTYITNLSMEDANKVIINWSDVERVNYSSFQVVSRELQALVSAYPTAFCGMSETIKKSLKTAPFFEKVKMFDTEDRALTRL